MEALTAVTFVVEVHGPFRVATGYAADGLDAAADHELPLPATALKGLARHHAEHVLDLPERLVDETFGSPAVSSPWSWSDASFDGLVDGRRAQTAIDSTTGVALERSLRVSGELWCRPGTGGEFRISLTGKLSDEELLDQLVTLVAGSCSIHSFGSDRRRGLGWCSVGLKNVEGRAASALGGDTWASTVAARCVELSSAGNWSEQVAP